MIKISKSTIIPNKLKTDGYKATKVLINKFKADPKSYSNGTKNFFFPDRIFNYHEVKIELRKAHHEKCCYCEKKVGKEVEEDEVVEHFRPKRGYRTTKGASLIRPCYFWLVYEWDNLFFSCTWCNRNFKENLFPIENERHRASKHHRNINKEKSLLINPSKDFPRKHIRFYGREVPKGITRKGKETIKVCGIDRDSLNNLRRKHIDDLEYRRVIISLPHKFSRTRIDKAKNFLFDAVKPSAKFSSMAIDFLNNENAD